MGYGCAPLKHTLAELSCCGSRLCGHSQGQYLWISPLSTLSCYHNISDPGMYMCTYVLYIRCFFEHPVNRSLPRLPSPFQHRLEGLIPILQSKQSEDLIGGVKQGANLEKLVQKWEVCACLPCMYCMYGHVYIWTYVCMDICMDICMYGHMYGHMYVWTCVWTYVCMDMCMDICMYGHMYVWTCVWTYVCMDMCMDICMYGHMYGHVYVWTCALHGHMYVHMDICAAVQVVHV